MMHDVNWWLMALSFLLGLLLTLVFTVRRVSREVPIYAALGRGPKAPAVEVKRPLVDVQKPKVPDVPKVAVKPPVVEVPKPDVKEAGIAAAATAATVVGATARHVKDVPAEAESVRLTRSVVAPKAEYLVKGDEDTMRYFTVESPDYEKVGAEVWFKDAASAERAGFLRWDAPGAYTVTDAVHGTVIRAGDTAAAATFGAVSGGTGPGPFGDGSVRAGAGGSGPAGWTIKGNEDSMLYHTTDSPSYEVTIAEVWFADEATAQRAGFARWDIRKHKN
jgi:hypothetical protein